MMTNTQDTKLQDAQTPIVFEQVQETINQIGYTHRPINQKTQVRNVFLDSIFAKDVNRSITTATYTEIPSYNYYNRVGNYNRDKTDGEIYIPVDGTYNISFYGIFEGNATGLRLMVLYVNTDPVDLDMYVCDGVNPVTNYLHVSQPYNLHKGDIITIQAYQSSGGPLDVTTNIKVIKLS